jgi:hypothetical protein
LQFHLPTHYFFPYLITCIFAIEFYSCNSSWIRSHMVSNDPWTTVAKTTTFSFIFAQLLKMDDIIGSFIFISSKFILVVSHNFICNFKSLCSWIYNYKSFLPCPTKDSYIANIVTMSKCSFGCYVIQCCENRVNLRSNFLGKIKGRFKIVSFWFPKTMWWSKQLLIIAIFWWSNFLTNDWNKNLSMQPIFFQTMAKLFLGNN